MDFFDNANTEISNQNEKQNENNFNNFIMSSEPIDEDEINRINARKQEEELRRKQIEDKINFELKQKEELRNQASDYIKDFEQKRIEKIEKIKLKNIENENEFLNNKKLINEGKINSWEIVVDNIAIKESDYKGTNDVSRMKATIIARKNDIANNNNIQNNNII